MKKNVVVVLVVITIIPLYLLINQALFELDLNKLQKFCDDLQIGLSFNQVEARVQERTSLRLSSPHIADDSAKYVDVTLEGQLPNGWACGLAFNREVLSYRVFGAEHGARNSFLDRR